MVLRQAIARDCCYGYDPTARLQTLLGWDKNIGAHTGIHGQEPAGLADHLDTPNDLLLPALQYLQHAAAAAFAVSLLGLKPHQDTVAVHDPRHVPPRNVDVLRVL